ncbi:hypothetical protein E6C27_scaffold62G00060 [Cucumis melo var. makuwa]|uniref:Mucin-19-like n=1 Tax=Cucumis melo var. makuwa TaxID=1194695 RepID=A0A5A7VE17_CUCMM|nr:hypothetical protein E6C27_scaffold62G00060 [Cucumis melo var. makuwa]
MPSCVLRPTVSVDAQSPSAALKQSRSSNSTKPRSVPVVERPKIVARGCPGFKLTRPENPLSVRPAIQAAGGSVERGLDRGTQLSFSIAVMLLSTVASVPSGVRSCLRIDTDVQRYVVVYCLDIDHGVLSWKDCVSFGITRLIRASFGITRLICASFGITKLICASLGITRLIGVSFGITRLIGVCFGITRLIGVCFRITRLIRASFGITGLMCKGTARGRPTRGKKDA